MFMIFPKVFCKLLGTEEEKRNQEISKLIQNSKFDFNKVTLYKHHPISPDSIYALMINNRDLYEGIINLFKFSLLYHQTSEMWIDWM